MQRRFLLKVILAVMPFLLVIGILYDIALKLGDANPPLLVVRQQERNPDLIYMPPWTRTDQFYYKFTAANYRQPQVLILGSSRMYHWRVDVMFDDSAIGYNASIPSAEPIEMLWFLEGLAQRNNLPEVLILGVDDLFYNQSGSFVRSNRVDAVVPPFEYGYHYAFGGFRAISRHYLNKPQRIIDFYRSYQATDFLGYTAQNDRRGYRPDGSFYFSNLDSISPDLIAYHDTIYSNNQGIFQQGSEVFQPAIDATEEILQIAQAHQIQVVGVYPPYHTSHYERMMASGNYSYIPQVRDQLTTLFEDYQLPLLDYTDPRTVGGRNEEMYDYLHAGDVLGLRVYQDMVNSLPDIFAPYSDAERLSQVINSAQHRFYLP